MKNHPKRVFPNSTYHIVGDSAFPCSVHVIPAIKAALVKTTSESVLNHKLSMTRIVVEQAFGLLKNRWRRLGHIATDVRKCVQITAAFCCLHNFIISNEAPILAADNSLISDSSDSDSYFSESETGCAKRKELIHLLSD